MPQISLRQVIYIVIGFAFFFACVTLAVNGNQFFQVISLAGASLCPIFFVLALTFVICKIYGMAVAPMQDLTQSQVESATGPLPANPANLDPPPSLPASIATADQVEQDPANTDSDDDAP